MNKTTCNIKFHSSLAPLIEKFVQEKHACGYKYSTGIDSLRRLDRLLCQHKLEAIELPKALVELWISKNPNETSRTHRARIGLVRQLADFMIRHGYSAYLPDARLAPKGQSVFVPRIFSHEEMRELLNAAEGIVANPRSPLRHLVMPQILQLLYGCGLRVGEVIRLRVDDVDLFSGVLTIRQSKFRKDRLVPIAPSLAQRLRHYADALGHRDPKAMFFPAPHMSSYHRQTIYYAFRQLLWQCRIPHGGRGRGPRLHDIRHYSESLTIPSRMRFCV